MVSVYDHASALFGRPAFVRTRGEAVRSFQDEVNRPSSGDQPNALNAHAGDFALYFLGMFDDSSGRFECPALPEKLADASGLLIKGA